jgi:hypothetical protein
VVARLTVREYRALEASDTAITYDLWKRMVDVFQWPRGLAAED